MSSLVNKVKDTVSGNKQSSGAPEGVHGTHNSRAANAADPRIDSDRDHRAAPTHSTLGGTTGTHTTAGTHTAGTHTTGTHTTGTHTTGTHTGTGAYTHGPASTTDGPHKSNVLNKADPRVDSDRDASRNMGMNPHGTATTGTGPSTTHGTTGTHTAHGATTVGHGTTTGSGVSEGTVGPHGSRAANAADPRVDSDLDSGRNRGIGGTTGSSGLHGTTGTSGLHSTTGTTGSSGLHGTTGTSGLHSTTGTTGTSGLHSTTGTTGTSGLHGTHGTHGTTGTTGTSGLTTGTNAGTHAHNTRSTTTTTGPAPNTAGPHKSDMMNKLDPRVDSDLDGSKTTGGNKTFSQSSTAAHKDPTDAAQVPPSVLQKHVGAPSVEHDHHGHDREARHSISHQENHRGL